MKQNPFLSDIFPDGFPGLLGALSIHQNALDQLLAMVDEAALIPTSSPSGGRTVLLRAQRAGFGKSHLLDRLKSQVRGRAALFIASFDLEKGVKWGELFWQILENFHQDTHQHEAGLTSLDEMARHIFALVNQSLIREGKVPCANPRQAIAALETRYVELFDLNDPQQAVGKWFLDHFERLLPTSAHILARQCGMSAGNAESWLRALCAYTQGLVDGPSVRMESLRWALQQSAAPGISSAGMMISEAPALDESFHKQKIAELCRMASLARPVIFVFDHLDAFHGNREVAMKIAYLITELRRFLPRALIISSMNQDLWAETFQRSIPSALEDRLTGGEITLGGLSRQEAEILLRQRLRHAGVDAVTGEAFLARVDLGGLMVREAGRLISPRTVLRHAARIWSEIEREASSGVSPLKVQDAALFGQPLAASIREAGISPSEEAPTGATSFEHLRAMLEKTLRRSEPENSGVVLADPTPANPPPPAPDAPFVFPPSPVLTEFHSLRQSLQAGPPLAMDVDRICHLLSIGGRRLAVVRSSHIPLAATDGQEALLWQTPDGEVLFGCEPAEDKSYWRALLTLTKERSLLSPASISHSAPRLVVFGTDEHPLDLGYWLRQDEIVEAKTHFLDLVQLGRESLSTLYAADELLLKAEQAEFPASLDEVLTQLAPELDFFWKRVTRRRVLSGK